MVKVIWLFLYLQPDTYDNAYNLAYKDTEGGMHIFTMTYDNMTGIFGLYDAYTSKLAI